MNEAIIRTIAQSEARRVKQENVTTVITEDGTPYDFTFGQQDSSLMVLEFTVLGVADDSSGRIVYKSNVIADKTSSLIVTEIAEISVDTTITGANAEVLNVSESLVLRLTGYSGVLNWLVVVEKWNVNANPAL